MAYHGQTERKNVSSPPLAVRSGFPANYAEAACEPTHEKGAASRGPQLTKRANPGEAVEFALTLMRFKQTRRRWCMGPFG